MESFTNVQDASETIEVLSSGKCLGDSQILFEVKWPFGEDILFDSLPRIGTVGAHLSSGTEPGMLISLLLSTSSKISSPKPEWTILSDEFCDSCFVDIGRSSLFFARSRVSATTLPLIRLPTESLRSLSFPSAALAALKNIQNRQKRTCSKTHYNKMVSRLERESVPLRTTWLHCQRERKAQKKLKSQDMKGDGGKMLHNMKGLRCTKTVWRVICEGSVWFISASELGTVFSFSEKKKEPKKSNLEPQPRTEPVKANV